MTLHDKLRRFRKSVGLTQEQMAGSLGIGRTTYTNIERGTAAPTALFLNCLCAVYGLDRDSLLDESDDALPAQSAGMAAVILEKYNELDDKYKAFILKQINELLRLQNEPEDT